MKKLSLSLALILTVLFIAAPSVSAAERRALDPEVIFENQLAKMTVKHEEQLIAATTRFEENKAKAQDHITFKLALVAKAAPELYDLYDVAFGDHVTIHDSLFAQRVALRTEGFDLMVAGLTALKESLFPLVESGEMTYKEVAEALKAYKEEQRATYKAIMDVYKSDIADLEAANEANKVMVDELKVELRAAVEAEDLETANAIITELYDYLVAHVTYDEAKLERLEAIKYE